jgi:hypothetical protein
MMQGLTSADPGEQRAVLEALLATTADTYYMHESFHADDPAQYTRSWFAWANSLFSELVIRWVEGASVNGGPT